VTDWKKFKEALPAACMALGQGKIVKDNGRRYPSEIVQADDKR
jgi:hypothetical protein